LVIYGHYDVAFANIDHDWKSDPWRLTGRDGFLYGRGVSDDKGPVLACLYAAYELYQAGNLGMDLVFVIEGEEESGYSLDERSFPDFVKENQHWFKGCKVTAFCCFENLRGLRKYWFIKCWTA
jgi:di- and tripeptidase